MMLYYRRHTNPAEAHVQDAALTPHLQCHLVLDGKFFFTFRLKTQEARGQTEECLYELET